MPCCNLGPPQQTPSRMCQARPHSADWIPGAEPGSARQRIRGVTYDTQPTLPHLPGAQVPGLRPAWALWTRMWSSPSLPNSPGALTLPCGGSWAGLGIWGWGRGWPQDCHPQELFRRRLRDGPLMYNKAQMTFPLWPGLHWEGGMSGLTEYPSPHPSRD